MMSREPAFQHRLRHRSSLRAWSSPSSEAIATKTDVSSAGSTSAARCRATSSKSMPKDRALDDDLVGTLYFACAGHDDYEHSTLVDGLVRNVSSLA